MLRDEMEKLDNVICQLNRAEKGKKAYTQKHSKQISHVDFILVSSSKVIPLCSTYFT